MGLKGSLRDFGISEILQLIGLQRRSGMLTINGEQDEYRIMIDSGKIVRVEKKPEREGESLQEYITISKTATVDQIRYAEQRAKTELKPLEATLIDLSVIPAQDLKTFLGLRNQDILNQLFLIRDGEYEFEAGQVTFHPSFVAELDTEQVLMDGYRIKDEWPGLNREAGSLEAVFVKKGGEFGLEDKLDAFEEKVYRLVDGEKPASIIAAQARITRFDTLKILVDLAKKGRVALKPQEKVAVREPKKLPVQALTRIGMIAMIAIAALLLLNGVRVYISRSKQPEKASSLQTWKDERTRQALEIYRLENGDWPARLDELVNKRVLPASDLKFLKNSRYSIQEGGLGYNLASPAPEQGTGYNAK
jgi:hypothetical protein